MTNRAPIAEPIDVAKISKNRMRNETLRVTLSQFEGRSLINVRLWQTGADGIDRPTVKGVALGIRKLPELAKALAKAETKARELGLIDDAASDEAAP
jgi:hypothetical protein